MSFSISATTGNRPSSAKRLWKLKFQAVSPNPNALEVALNNEDVTDKVFSVFFF